MRIAYFLNSLGVGGAERQVLGLARRMAERGHAVKLFVLLPRGEQDWSVEYGPNPLETVHLGIGRSPVAAFRALSRGKEELRRFNPDLVHSHNFQGNLAARILRPFSGKAPVVSTIHNVYEGGWPRMLAYRLTDRLSCRTIAVSQAACDRYVALRAVSGRRAGVITNGIETEEFMPDAEQRARTRAELRAGSGFLWVATARLTEAKDHPNLLHAFAQVVAVAPSARLWIAGSGEAGYATELRALSHSLELSTAVRWLGQRNDVPALLDAADGFVLSSAWEGMPLAAGEAMAMEKPVVSTDVGGLRELCGDLARLVPTQNSGSLAEAMLQTMWMDEAARAELGRAGRARIMAQFSMDAKAGEWEELYASVLR